MPSDASPDDGFPPPVDVGLLSPVTASRESALALSLVSDDAIVDALVTAEVALVRAYAQLGAATPETAEAVSAEFGWDGTRCHGHGIGAAQLAVAGVDGGNPVIPLAGIMRARVPESARGWVHRGATSQDILDTALAIVAKDAADQLAHTLAELGDEIEAFAVAHRDEVAVARTLTQHAVPTTVGARAAGWLRAVDRARARLVDARVRLPAQLGGAAGTLAAFAEDLGGDAAAALPRDFATQVGLAPPKAPWHTDRWPITEIGDAFVGVLDVLGKTAGDVATLSRPEIGELAEGAPGGSSTMPQKQNPVRSVLIRSTAIRAPQLGATLHLAAALAVDERPDGAWHAEWPTLRELLRLGLGAAANAVGLVAGLAVDHDAVARNLALSGGLVVSERLGIVLVPLIGRDRFGALVAEADAGADLAELVRALPEAAALDVDALLEPRGYIGLAGRLVDDAVRRTQEDAG